MSSQTALRKNLLQLLYDAGDLGCTDYELAERSGADKNHVPTRRRDLELNDLCRKTGVRRPTDTGTPAIVHCITAKGREYVELQKPVPARPAGLYDPGLFRRVVEHINAGYSFACKPLDPASGEGFSATLTPRHMKTFDDYLCGVGETPTLAVEELLQQFEQPKAQAA